MTDDKNKGIYRKYRVERTDGRSAPGEKHADCFYFVLDCDHDPHAAPALRAYADSAEADGYVNLAVHARLLANRVERGFSDE